MSSLVASLIEKFPPFNPTWPPEAIERWLATYQAVLALAGRIDATARPPAPEPERPTRGGRRPRSAQPTPEPRPILTAAPAPDVAELWATKPGDIPAWTNGHERKAPAAPEPEPETAAEPEPATEGEPSAAQPRRHPGGRPATPEATIKQINELTAAGVTILDIAAQIGVAASTVGRYANAYRKARERGASPKEWETMCALAKSGKTDAEIGQQLGLPPEMVATNLAGYRKVHAGEAGFCG